MDNRLEMLGVKPPPPPPPVVLPPVGGQLLDVRGRALEYTALAIDTLASVARMGRSESARVAAAAALLERAHGKVPVAAVEVGEGINKIRVEIVG